jgi:hypothetical protein
MLGSSGLVDRLCKRPVARVYPPPLPGRKLSVERFARSDEPDEPDGSDEHGANHDFND